MFPDRSKTFGTLLLDLAEELNLVRRAPTPQEVTDGADPLDNSRRLPDDPATLERVKRAANDGASDMERAVYKGRSVKWSWLRPSVPISLPATAGPLNIAGDNGRLLLDRRIISAPLGEVIWTTSDGNWGHVVSTHEDRVVADWAARGDVTGPPRLCAIRPVQGTAMGDRIGHELIVSPRPDADYTITSRFRFAAAPMYEASERPSWPEVHDRCWLAFAVAAFYGKAVTAQMLANRDGALEASVAIDTEMAPKTLGQVGAVKRTHERQTPAILDVDGNVLVP